MKGADSVSPLMKTFALRDQFKPIKIGENLVVNYNGGHVAALVMSHMNGFKSFDRTVQQTTETLSPSSTTISAGCCNDDK